MDEAIYKQNKGPTDDVMKRDASTFLRGVGRITNREGEVGVQIPCTFGWLGNAATHSELWEKARDSQNS